MSASTTRPTPVVRLPFRARLIAAYYARKIARAATAARRAPRYW